MPSSAIWCLVFASVLSIGLATGDAQVTGRLTYENLITNDERVFHATKLFKTTRKSTYEIMRDIEKVDSRFTFKTREHRLYGHFVTHVNGVEGDWNEKLYWAFLRRASAVDCLLPLGVSSYVPSDGEHLVLSLQRYPNNLVYCNSRVKTTTTTEAPTTDAPCHAELSRRSDVTGSYVPQCTDDGKFTPVQCHGSTGYCWCVSVYGVEVEGTRKGPGEGPIDCEKDFKDLASVRQKRSILSRLIPRPHPPGIPRPPPRPHPPPPPPHPRPRRPLDWF